MRNTRNNLWTVLQKVYLATILSVLALGIYLPENSPASANENMDSAIKLFGQKCTGCHTIGKGKLIGPDLKEVVDWHEAEVTSAVKRMQKMAGPLNDDEIKGLVKFLMQADAGELIKKQEEKVEVSQAKDLIGSADVGQRLFSGAERFTNGGPSCIACHRAEGTGGTMGPDLNGVFAKFGESALASACEQTNFKVMKAVYSNHPITRQEALNLTKYFASLKDKQSATTDAPVGTIGFVGACLFLVVIAVSYRRRKTSARDKLNRR